MSKGYPLRGGAGKRGSDSPQWKGDAVGYSALHRWVRKNYTEPDGCEHCGTTEAALEWANVSGDYRRDRDDWLALCRSCHRALDRPTHCKHGHEWTPENTITNVRQRLCRTCVNVRKRRWYAKKQGREAA